MKNAKHLALAGLTVVVGSACLGGCVAGEGGAIERREGVAASPSIDGPWGDLLLDPRDRAVTVERLAGGDLRLIAARDALVAEAEAWLEKPVRPITAGKESGKRVAPSGDPRDYVSLSPYWWPDPRVPSGEPYVRRDGEINPERYEYDTPKLDDFGKAVRELAFAYAVTGDERYADKAIEHVRAWFVEPETRMTPSMRFAQFVPGVSLGRNVGIIDTNRLRWMPDSLVILQDARGWTGRDTRETRRWFEEYSEWLMSSDLGIAERNAENNHGTWFASQVVGYALYAGRKDIAREVLKSVPARIDQQFEADGRQPHELERTKALDYTEFNIRGHLDLAKYAEHVKVDLAHYASADGASVRRALDWALPYMTGEKEWPYKQIAEPRHHMYYQTLRVAARVYDEPRYERAIDDLRDLPKDLMWFDLMLPSRHDVD